MNDKMKTKLLDKLNLEMNTDEYGNISFLDSCGNCRYQLSVIYNDMSVVAHFEAEECGYTHGQQFSSLWKLDVINWCVDNFLKDMAEELKTVLK